MSRGLSGSSGQPDFAGVGERAKARGARCVARRLWGELPTRLPVPYIGAPTSVAMTNSPSDTTDEITSNRAGKRSKK